jgi:hypothetical protein
MTSQLALPHSNNLLHQHIDLNNPVQVSRLNQFAAWLSAHCSFADF